MMTDPIADLLTHLRNASVKNHSVLFIPASKMKEAICQVLVKEKLIRSCEVEEHEGKNQLKIELHPHKPLHLRRRSTPGRRLYIGSEDLPSIKSGLGIAVISTSKGVISSKQARKEKIGGEILCEVY